MDAKVLWTQTLGRHLLCYTPNQARAREHISQAQSSFNKARDFLRKTLSMFLSATSSLCKHDHSERRETTVQGRPREAHLALRVCESVSDGQPFQRKGGRAQGPAPGRDVSLVLQGTTTIDGGTGCQYMLLQLLENVVPWPPARAFLVVPSSRRHASLGLHANRAVHTEEINIWKSCLDSLRPQVGRCPVPYVQS